MRSPVPRGKKSITHQNELEARVLALEAIVGALLRFSAGKQDLASALKEARSRGESSVQDSANNASPDYMESYRDSFHTLAVSMIPLQELESFRASLQKTRAADEDAGEEGARGSASSY
jgi:hypothetical protein